ncbi:MAG: hypothetical protein IKP30_01675 [Bacteroidaceae bacterium]|nr:hypothetical protein [Bacteroidaceae bacterium]
MKKLLPILLLILGCAYCSAEVKYGGMSYSVQMRITKENGEAFLNFRLQDLTKVMTESPKMLIKLMNDSVLNLEGTLMSTSHKNEGGVVVYNIVVESEFIVSDAKFPITPEQIQQIGSGVKKLRLNTSPNYHEKEWKKDKIGKKLYEEYLNCSPNSFEDKF